MERTDRQTDTETHRTDSMPSTTDVGENNGYAIPKLLDTCSPSQME